MQSLPVSDLLNQNQDSRNLFSGDGRLSDPVISDNSDLQFTLDLSTPLQFSFDPNSFHQNSQDSNLQDVELSGFGVQSSTSPRFPGKTIDFTFPQTSPESEMEFGRSPNSIEETETFPSSGLDFSSPEENKGFSSQQVFGFAAQHNLVDGIQNSLDHETSQGSPQNNLIPGVFSYSSAAFSTGAFKPSPGSFESQAHQQDSIDFAPQRPLAPRSQQDNQHILTNRPMTFQTASGKFEPPSTLLYGFQPMTTPLPSPSSHPASHSSASKPSSGSPASLDVRLQQGGKEQGRRRKPRQTSVLQRISNFLEPLTRPITRLMAGL